MAGSIPPLLGVRDRYPVTSLGGRAGILLLSAVTLQCLAGPGGDNHGTWRLTAD